MVPECLKKKAERIGSSGERETQIGANCCRNDQATSRADERLSFVFVAVLAVAAVVNVAAVAAVVHVVAVAGVLFLFVCLPRVLLLLLLYGRGHPGWLDQSDGASV